MASVEYKRYKKAFPNGRLGWADRGDNTGINFRKALESKAKRRHKRFLSKLRSGVRLPTRDRALAFLRLEEKLNERRVKLLLQATQARAERDAEEIARLARVSRQAELRNIADNARGSIQLVEIRRRNGQTVTWTAPSVADIQLVAALASGEYTGPVTVGYKKLAKLIREGLAPGGLRVLNRLVAFADGTPSSYSMDDNVYSSGNEGGSIERMEMRKSIWKPLAHVTTIEYDVPEKDKCVEYYFRHILDTSPAKFGKKKLRGILTHNLDNITYPELTKVLSKYSIGMNVWSVDGRRLQTSISKKVLNIVPHDGHLYVLKRPFKLNTYSNTEKLGMDVWNETLDNSRYRIAIDHSDYAIVDKTRYNLEYDKSPIRDFMCMTGPYNNNEVEFFNRCGIRPATYQLETLPTLKLDLSSAYKAIISNPMNVFPISDGLGVIREYSGSIRAECFYRIVLPMVTPFVEFFNLNDVNHTRWVYGSLVLYLQKFAILAPDIEYTTNNICHGNRKVDTIPKGIANRFTGCLARTELTYDTNYITTDQNEIDDLLSNLPNARVNQHGVTSKRSYMKGQTGCLAYLAIYDYARMCMLDMWEHAGSPPIVSIYTDCVGMLSDWDGELITDSGVKFKKEAISDYKFNPYEPEVWDVALTDLSPPKECTPGPDAGCLINGLAGLGKSYYFKHVLYPKLPQGGIISSTTRENANSWKDWAGVDVHPIQTHLKKAIGWDQILDNFKDVPWLMIDEASQLTMNLLHLLQKLKIAYPEMRIYLIGDSNQCLSMDGVNYFGTPVFNFITDSNIKTMEYHPQCRFTREYYDMLIKITQLIDVEPAGSSVVRNLLESFPNYEATCVGPNIVWRHKTGKKLGVYSTIHSTQGKTFDHPYNMYDIDAPLRVLYTGLSRASGFDNIYITP